MLSEEVTLQGVDPLAWRRFISWGRACFLPELGTSLLLIARGDTLIKAIHSEKGPVSGIVFRNRDTLAETRMHAGVSSAILIDMSRLGHALSKAESSVHVDDDLLDQCSPFLQTVGREMGRGIVVDPPSLLEGLLMILGQLPNLLRLALSADGTYFVALARQGDLWSSIAFEVTRKEISRIWTPEQNAHRGQGLSVSDLGQGLANDLASQGHPPVLGCTVDGEWIESGMKSSDLPSLFLQGLEERQIVIHPVPFRLSLALAGLRSFKALTRNRDSR